jgi:putative transposase
LIEKSCGRGNGYVVRKTKSLTLLGDRMMGKYYQKKTNRSKRKMRHFDNSAVTVSLADGKASFQMVLPMGELLFDVAGAIEQTASEAGLRMMKALIDEEVEQLAGDRYRHQPHRQAIRWGKEEGHLIFAGRKVAMERPRVRSRDSQEELPLRRWNAFAHPRRMEQAVQNKVLRRVSCRDYGGAIEEMCDGYGIDKSSVSRKWQAASAKQLSALMERRLDDLDIGVILLDGKEFGDTTIITALGIDMAGNKHILGLWPGATENSDVCGSLLDDIAQRGVSVGRQYLFVIDGSKALKKAIIDRFGVSAMIQRCRIHKERNIRSYLPKKHHRLLAMKLKAAFGMTEYAEALRELRKVHTWLMSISDAAAASLEEGFEELLTVNKLKLPVSLKKFLGSTNMIESCYSLTGDLCRNVKRWRGESMARRWAGAMLLETEKRFYRIRGHREMPMLAVILKRIVDTKEVIA